jgi:hypothetical protein
LYSGTLTSSASYLPCFTPLLSVSTTVGGNATGTGIATVTAVGGTGGAVTETGGVGVQTTLPPTRTTTAASTSTTRAPGSTTSNGAVGGRREGLAGLAGLGAAVAGLVLV